MEERKSFLFYRSFWSGGSKLKPRERLAFYDALAQYAFTGQETSLPHNAAICWEFAKPLIDSNNKKYADGSKGGRPQKTTGFDDDITTGSDSLKNISEDKEKEKDKREGKGERRTRQARNEKKPQTAVFSSLPSGTNRIGYAGTEELKKRQIQKIEQLLTIFEKNSIEEVKVRGFDWKPSTEQETRIRTAILADQREELERLKAELAAL